MTTERRKAAIAAYKRRKPPAGIFALRSAAAGKIWVGQTRDLEKIWNRISFSLKTGADPRRELQAAWNAHGEAGFAFEALERLDDETLDYALQSALDDRLTHWRDKLGATAI